MAAFKISKVLDDLVGGGKITKATREKFDVHYEASGSNYQKAMEDLKADVERVHQNKIRNAVKRDELFTAQDEAADPGTFVTNTVTKGLGASSATSNVDYKSKAVNGVLEAGWVDSMEAMKTKVAGFTQDRAAAHDLVKALYGDTSNPKATAMAKGWADLAERARLWFNRVGGDIKKLTGWHLPQGHHAGKIKKLGKEAWVRMTKDLLDVRQMEVLPSELDNVLREVYETITTGGMNKIDVTAVDQTPTFGKTKANSRQEARFLVFKDADSWLKYQEAAGNPDIYQTMKDHIRSMSDDIAMLEVYGTDPERTFHDLQLRAKKKGKLGAYGTMRQQNMFDVVSGRVDQDAAITGGDEFFSTAAGGYRAMKTGSLLGSAMVSAITDPIMTMMTAGYNKMNPITILGKGMGDALMEMGSIASSTERVKLAARIGVVSDAFSGSIANSRYAESAGGSTVADFMQKRSENVLRASGLTAWTNGWRAGFSLEFMGNLGDFLGKSLDDGGMGDVLKRYGVTQAEWDRISAANPIRQGDTAGFFNAAALSKTEPDLAVRILEIVNEELDYAVIMPDARVRAITTFGGAKGTLKGEAGRALTMFKSFPIAIITHHIGRIMFGDMSTMGKIQYAASLGMGLTMMGVLSIQIRELLKGKEPREVFNKDGLEWKVALQGALQGGAIGIFGDLIFQDTTRYGAGFASTFSSPLVGDLEAIYKLTKGNYDKAVTGKDTHFGSDAVRLLQSNTPGQNLWYTRLLTDRYIFDKMKGFTDPKYKKKVNTQTKRMRKDYNQKWWWKPGKNEPE